MTKPILTEAEIKEIREKASEATKETLGLFSGHKAYTDEMINLASQAGYEKQPCICDSCLKRKEMKEMVLLCKGCIEKDIGIVESARKEGAIMILKDLQNHGSWKRFTELCKEYGVI